MSTLRVGFGLRRRDRCIARIFDIQLQILGVFLDILISRPPLTSAVNHTGPGAYELARAQLCDASRRLASGLTYQGPEKGLAASQGLEGHKRDRCASMVATVGAASAPAPSIVSLAHAGNSTRQLLD